MHLAEVSAELAARKAAEFGFEKSTADWRTLIADPEVEAVSITAPNAFHAEMAIAALEAPGHGLGVNELKIIACHELLNAIAGKPARIIGFAEGLGIERTVHAMARSHEQGQWINV